MGKRGNQSRAWNKRKRLKNRKMGKSVQPDGSILTWTHMGDTVWVEIPIPDSNEPIRLPNLGLFY